MEELAYVGVANYVGLLYGSYMVIIGGGADLWRR